MASVDFSEGRRYLAQLSDWAKRSSIKLVEEEEFSKAGVLMDLAEQGKRIIKELGEDGIGDVFTEESEGRQSSEEGGVEEIQGKYPLFFIQGSYLVKQGLSRDKRSVHEQKAPKIEVGKILEILVGISRNGREFEVNELLIAVRAPNYQLYIVLGVLLEVGLLQIPRRGTYSFVGRERFSLDADSLWERVSANNPRKEV
jgi:hypothetical protein